MRILFLVHSFNSMAQRLFVELGARGHEVSIEFDVNDRVTEEAVALFRPELIIAPFLKRAIPESVWRRCRCLIVHPGIKGDRGPSALDWAVQEGEDEWGEWGVTVIEATGEMDAGDIWAAVEYPMRAASKGSLYRNEAADAAVEAVLLALKRMRDASYRPEPLDYSRPAIRGRLRPAMKQSDRAIDWRRDESGTILRKIRAADGSPGVLDEVCGEPCHLYDAHPEGVPGDATPGATPGELIGRRDGAILRATIDGAIWIGSLKRAGGGEPGLKLPATMVLGARAAGLPELPAALRDEAGASTYREIRYVERNAVGYVHFDFYNGAMSTGQCRRLAEAIRFAKSRPTRVIALMGGTDFWSNGIHLNVIEASATPADESWANINAMDDAVYEILACERQLTVAALQGNAGAGGVFLALAADRVAARRGVVLNPHYKGMGNLYGSEYWTYVLPRRLGTERAHAVTQGRLPLGAAQAAALGLIDEAVPGDLAAFRARITTTAEALAAGSDFEQSMSAKRARRTADEAVKPLERYRAEELARMKLNFYGFDPSYHVARYHFVFKLPRSRTPPYLARHRAIGRTSARAGANPTTLEMQA